MPQSTQQPLVVFLRLMSLFLQQGDSSLVGQELSYVTGTLRHCCCISGRMVGFTFRCLYIADLFLILGLYIHVPFSIAGVFETDHWHQCRSLLDGCTVEWWVLDAVHKSGFPGDGCTP